MHVNVPLLAFSLLTTTLFAQQGTKNTPPPAGPVKLSCKIIGMPASVDSLNLYEGAGLALKSIARVGYGPDSMFTFTVPASAQPKFYGVGLGENAVGHVLLGTEPNVTLWGNAQYMEKARTTNSAVNRELEQAMRRCEAFNQQELEYQSAFQQASNPSNPPLMKRITDEARALSESKKQFLDSLRKASPNTWRTITLRTHPEFLANNNNRYPGIADFYGKEAFGYVNWSDKQYADEPLVASAFQDLTTRLLELGATEDQMKQHLTEQIRRIPSGTFTHRMALGAVVSTLKNFSHPLYPTLAKDYIGLYRNDSYGEIGPLEFDIKKNATFTPGMEAPDLVGPTPEGQTLALSELKGKIVLIDFWASWCGPCRRENPNVVANYTKYKEKGFEILGVSLDKNADAWKKAIADDGLTWKHISDLKGWSSDHARLYSVNSIPQTLLLDKEGKIIQRNLRGEQLTAKLEELFGF
jgi:peroxiredoxin